VPGGLACTGQLVITNPTGRTASVLFNPSPIVVGLVLANGPLQGGNNFVIQGRWFYPGTTVTVGGTNATIVSMTPGTATTLGSIVVTAPSSATSGPKPVVVTSPTGCVNTGAFDYAYN
jgi:hypothetical protein